MPTQKPPSLRDIELLGRHWGVIFGQALAPETLGTGTIDPPPVSGRPDHVDAHSPQIWRGLRALSALQEMARRGPEYRRAAAVLCYYHASTGETARASGAALVRIAEGCGSESLGEAPELPRRASRGWVRGAEAGERVELQRALWRRWTARRGALVQRGLALYREAVGLWEGFTSGEEARA
jgi:hypothetical protein